MTRLIVRRVLWSIVVLWGVLSGVFFLANAVGDRASGALGPRASAAQLEAYRHAHGLDRPLSVQYAEYMGGLLQGDFGSSDRDGQPVGRVMAIRLPRTLLLGFIALGIQALLGLLLGTLAALRRNTWFDTGFMALAFFGISAPTFLTGVLGLYLFSFRLGWFPIGGYGLGFFDHVYHALLPALILAIFGAATYARIMRNEMIETMQADFIRTARAKGLSPLSVVMKHGVRNALLPIVTLMGLSLPLLVSGALITETIFNWPGMGRLAYEAIYAFDLPVILGVTFVASSSVLLGNLLADLAVAALDPRVRMGQKGA